MPKPATTFFQKVAILVGDTFRDGFRLKYNTQADQDARYFWLETDGRLGIANEAGDELYLNLASLFYLKSEVNGIALPGPATTTTAGLVRRATDAEALGGNSTTTYLSPYQIAELFSAIMAGVPRSFQPVATSAGQTAFTLAENQIPAAASILRVERPLAGTGALKKDSYTWAGGVLTLLPGALADPIRAGEYLHVDFTSRADGASIFEAMQFQVLPDGDVEYRFGRGDWQPAGNLPGATLISGAMKFLSSGTPANPGEVRLLPAAAGQTNRRMIVRDEAGNLHEVLTKPYVP